MSRLIIAGIVLIFALLLGIGLTFAQTPVPCSHLEAVLSAQHRWIILDDWKARRLVQIHKDKAPFAYTLPGPVSSVLLTFDNTGSVLLGLIILQPDGVKVCAPLRFEPQAWEEVSSDLWGRGA